MASCGTLTVEEAEAEFDPALVEVTSCSIPGTTQPDEEITLEAAVRNGNDVEAVDVDVIWRDTGGAGVLKRDPNNSVPANSSRTITATVVPSRTIGTGEFTIEATVESPQAAAAAAVPGNRVSRSVLGALEGEIAGVDRRTVATATTGAGLGLAAALIA